MEAVHATRDEQLWYYRGIVTALRGDNGAGAITNLVDELDDVVRAFEAEAG